MSHESDSLTHLGNPCHIRDPEHFCHHPSITPNDFYFLFSPLLIKKSVKKNKWALLLVPSSKHIETTHSECCPSRSHQHRRIISLYRGLLGIRKHTSKRIPDSSLLLYKQWCRIRMALSLPLSLNNRPWASFYRSTDMSRSPSPVMTCYSTWELPCFNWSPIPGEGFAAENNLVRVIFKCVWVQLEVKFLTV